MSSGVGRDDGTVVAASVSLMAAPTGPGSLPAVVRDEIVRLNPSRIMLIGGSLAVSDTVAAQLRGIAVTERVSGTDRYGTARPHP